MSTVEPKPIYAPLPARAIGDKNLTAEELRVLGALAVHDRLGANGMGCYASHSRLAALVGCHEKSLSRSLSNLAARGYISANRHPLNARLRVYRVNYTTFDAAYLKSIGNKPATYEGTFKPVGGATGNMNGSKPVTETPRIGNKPNPETERNQYDDSVNILGEAIRYPAEAINTSVETAPKREKAKSVGTKLAMLEHGFKAHAFTKTEIRDEVLPWLEGLVSGDLEYGTPDYGRAFRLYEDLGGMLS